MESIKSQLKTLSDLDKSTWNVVRFSDIAFNISERVEPNDTDAETYVGLEHLDTNSTHIRRKGKPGDVKGTKLKVYKGDIIFGKRRAYQRKASISDFDGICSAHSMVLRANSEVIDSDLFPFFIHSDAFMNRAIEVSEGSLSPTIKWKILGEQKFRLPPKEMQKKLAEIFWAVDEVEEKYLESLGEATLLRQSIFDDVTRKKTSLRNLGDCLVLSKAKSLPPHKEENYIGLEHITSGAFYTDKFMISRNVASVCSIFRKGQLLYSKLRPNLDKAVIATFDGVCTTELLVYEAEKEISLGYILHHLHSDRFVKYAISQGFGTKMPRISHKILSGFRIYVPDYDEQLSILNRLTKIRETENELLAAFRSTRILRDSLINSVF